jgi:hypothetical protein
MIKYDHFICENAEIVTSSLEKYGILPKQIISITSKVGYTSAYKYEGHGSVSVDVNTYYVVFYWYEEN